MNITIKLNKKSLLPICAEDAPQKEKILRPECDADTQSFLSAVYKNGTQAKKRQADAPQYGRILPICAEDAPQFSNDVYNKRYTSEKIASRFKQSGRSMIEMLGVLAIIGVLTVGSITGYSRAMRRHLLNKQREQISYILSAVETNYDMLNLADLHNRSSNPTKTFETLGWIPEEMIKDNSNYIYDVFKNRISFYVWAYLYMGLTINITNNIPREQCINLYQMIQSYHSSLWLTEVATYDPKGLVSMNNAYYGDQYCVGGPKCIRNLTPAEISSMCHVCDNYDRCIFYIFWR